MERRGLQGILGGMPKPENEGRGVTMNGYDLGEVTSAMIKELRLSNVEAAAFWALELYDTAPFYTWKRLLLFASEDAPSAIGDLAPIALAWSLAASYSRSPRIDPEHVVHAVLVLARAVKDNIVDDLKNLVEQRRKRDHPEIPDYALDGHTRRGKAMGRGNAFWYGMRDMYLDSRSVYERRLREEFPDFVEKD